jgi:hypothetical protein
MGILFVMHTSKGVTEFSYQPLCKTSIITYNPVEVIAEEPMRSLQIP